MNRESFDRRKEKAIKHLVDEHIKKVEEIENHTYDQCRTGEHLLESFATGGRDGHCVSHCLICDYKTEGWD
jgi:hypothetical protein